MLVSIYEKNTTDFSTLGLGTLIPTECEVSEELNGAFELTMSHPYDEWGKWERIEKGRIVLASTPRGNQPFRIYNVKPTMKSITVNARHIFYDLLDNMCSIAYTGSATNALKALVNSFNFSMPFSFSTDIAISGTMTMTKVNPVQALLAEANEDSSSFVSTYGGELLRDGFNVSMLNTIGRDEGVTIRYGKNLTGLEITEDDSEVRTRIHLYNDDGASVTLDSPYINNYVYPKIHIQNESSASAAEMRTTAQELLNGGIDLPSVNIKVEFIPLSKTVEFANFAVLEDVQLGDVVTIVNQKMNFSKQAKVISYKWDSLLEQYDTVELGDFVPTLVSSVSTGSKSYAVAASASTEAKQILSLISGNITIRDNYLYVAIDSTDYTASDRLFRFGVNGLEYSSDKGANWKTLITADGVVN